MPRASIYRAINDDNFERLKMIHNTKKNTKTNKQTTTTTTVNSLLFRGVIYFFFFEPLYNYYYIIVYRTCSHVYHCFLYVVLYIHSCV